MVDGGDFYPNSLVADPNTGCSAGAVAGLAAQFWGSVVDSSCLAAAGQNYLQCLLFPTLYPHIETPIFVATTYQGSHVHLDIKHLYCLFRNTFLRIIHAIFCTSTRVLSQGSDLVVPSVRRGARLLQQLLLVGLAGGDEEPGQQSRHGQAGRGALPPALQPPRQPVLSRRVRQSTQDTHSNALARWPWSVVQW